MRALLVIFILGCGHEHVDPFPASIEVDASQALIAATTKGDAAAVQKLLHAPLGYGGLVFHNADCNQRFATAGVIQEADLLGFALCLTTIKLQPSPNRTHELPDTAVLMYDPGIEIEARFEPEGHLDWIGYVARENLKDDLPTVQPRALAALMSTAPDPEPVAQKLEAERVARNLTALEFWFKLCIDTEGHVTAVHARRIASPESARIVADEMKTWTYRPFVFDGQPIAACSYMGFIHPATLGTPKLPMPPPPDTPASVVLGPKVLKRIAGERSVVPDDADKTRIAKAHVGKLTAALLYCIDETGHVTTGYVARSSGLPTYDAKLVRAIKQWQFEPFISDGKPLPVCSTAVFIYSQY